jgi:hypothetical protein
MPGGPRVVSTHSAAPDLTAWNFSSRFDWSRAADWGQSARRKKAETATSNIQTAAHHASVLKGGGKPDLTVSIEPAAVHYFPATCLPVPYYGTKMPRDL